MQEINISISGLSEDEKRAISSLSSQYCKVEESKGADGKIHQLITIIAEDPLICGIAGSLIAEIIKLIAKESWNLIIFSIKMADGEKYINLGKEKIIELCKKYFGTTL